MAYNVNLGSQKYYEANNGLGEQQPASHVVLTTATNHNVDTGSQKYYEANNGLGEQQPSEYVYAVAAGATPVSVTKSLKYTVKAPAALTKSLKYTVKITLAAITKSLKYAIKLSPTLTKSLKYTVKKAVSITESLKYTIKITPTAIIKSLTYCILNRSVLYQQLFNAASSIPAGWVEFGNSVWGYNSTDVVETTVGSADPNKVLYTGANLRQDRVVLAKLTIQALGTVDDRIGLSVLSRSLDGKGLNLVLRGNGGALALHFLDDGAAWSPTSQAMAPQVGEVWWFKAKYEAGTVYGKAWKDGTAEPAYQISWARSMGGTYIYSGLLGNSNALISRARYDDFHILSDAQTITKSLKYTVKTIHAAITKSLKYNVVGSVTTVAITKSLKYCVKTAIAVTKSLKYTVKAPAAITKSLKYTVIKSISITKSLKYTIRKSASITKSLKYTVKTIPAAITKSLKYTIKATPTALQKTLKYTVGKTVGMTKSLRYAVVKGNTLTKSLTYILSSIVPRSVTKSLKYCVVKARIITKQLIYKVVFRPAAATKSLRYAVDASQVATKSLKYTVKSAKVITLSLRYMLIVYTDKYTSQGSQYTDNYITPVSF